MGELEALLEAALAREAGRAGLDAEVAEKAARRAEEVGRARSEAVEAQSNAAEAQAALIGKIAAVEVAGLVSVVN